MIVRRSALLDQPAGHLFDIIEAAEHYPRFLPWCESARIVSRDDAHVSADLRVRWGGMSFEMRTHNPKRRPDVMAIHLERGPFRHFEGEWRLTALAPDACKVAFVLDYEFDSNLMTRAAGPVFNRIADTLVDAFVRRAIETAQGAGPAVSAPPPAAAALPPGPDVSAPTAATGAAAPPAGPGVSVSPPDAAPPAPPGSVDGSVPQAGR